MALPARVEIHEEGPREGFQIERPGFSIADRASLVEALADAGLRHIQVASFVNPKRVPQMADAAELFAAIRKRPGVRYTGLWLNEQGFERASATAPVDLTGTLFFYASDAFSRQNNGKGMRELAESQRGWVRRYREHGLQIESAYVMTAFGCNYEGEISEERLAEALRFIAALQREESFRLPALYLADTVGHANPRSVRRRIDLAREILPHARIGLHLHDTRGLGMANAFAALEMGVDLFDASVAGLGGCPFCGSEHGGAAGNICTEDLVFLCEQLGIETGLDLPKLLDAARLAERIIGRRLEGKLMHSGLPLTVREGVTA
ncbi:hydroxymethylglutaryl-CoA lyase [Ramlibacter humi]|uniref:Hydroxymethylglutaryl-CoA lyase n=1 Tax=Ramlibacter humi TaxID=2530451 RepID=A0A4Z0CAY2_9BURK|nr:hydroxymethylglutaryl-CoA lyase [Ramlibacter humi]TFZ08817.1 hydroxymethylglutaryl-CoA lyase [Ramlibacter humi]